MKTVFLKEEFEKSLSQSAKETILKCSEVADKFGFKIYLIGGVVRDLILGNQIFDIDIIVEGDAIEFANVLVANLNCQILQQQNDLKTAKVLFDSNIEIDFASTRCEEYSESGLLPIVKEMKCSLKEDVVRRDFTINSMALALNKDDRFSLVDYLDGQSAIGSKELIVLHEKSFIDDPSRIVRGLKFAIRFGFHLDKKTLELQNDYLDSKINRNMPLERIRSEIKQLLNLNSIDAYDEFVSQGIWKLICNKADLSIKGEQIKKVVDVYLKEDDKIWLIYLGCLLINEEKSALERLNLSGQEIKIISDAHSLLLNKNILKDTSDNFQIYKFFEGKTPASVLIYYIFTNDNKAVKYFKELSKVKLLISGDDLIKLGFNPSLKFSEIFTVVLQKKLNGEIETKNEEIEVAKSFL